MCGEGRRPTSILVFRRTILDEVDGVGMKILAWADKDGDGGSSVGCSYSVGREFDEQPRPMQMDR